MNISNMVTRVEASFICAKSRLLKPDERGTVAWNHAFKAWSPKLIGAKVRGLFDSIAHKRTKAIRFKPAMVDKISLLLVLKPFQRLLRLMSINTTKPVPPMMYSILMVKVMRY
ncbi:hypothetical protein D3C81_1861980 [compost metagenome]